MANIAVRQHEDVPQNWRAGTDAGRRLCEELRELCRGWGLQREKVRKLVGAAVSRWANIPGSATDADVRLQIGRAIDGLPQDTLLKEQLEAVRVALALDPDFQFPTLGKRTETLAQTRKWSDRTMRRKIDASIARLADVAATAVDPGDPATGWALDRVAALVRLDQPEPEVIEQRVIVSTTDGLCRIVARFSLPSEHGAPVRRREIAAQVLHGARMAGRSGDGLGYFEYLLELPQPLDRGQDLIYTMSYRVLDGRPIRPYYTLVPLLTCAAFDVTVRFALERPPLVVWRIDTVPYRVLDGPASPGQDVLPLDGACEATASFSALRPGFGYGIGWMPFPS